MLIRFLENYLISTVNRRLDRREQQAPAGQGHSVLNAVSF